MRVKAAALVLSLAWIAAANAAGPGPVEQALEATSATLMVPTALGRITARSCMSCPAQYLNLTRESKFFIGQNEVAFAEFQKAMASSTGHAVAVYYRAEDKSVTRILITTGL